MSRAFVLIAGLAIVGLQACVWRTESPAEAPSGSASADGTEEVSPGVKRTVTVDDEGVEHVDIEVDVDQADLTPPEPLELLPRPFTADQIRAGMPKGAKLTFQISGSRAGQAQVEWTITTHTPESVGISYVVQPENADPQEEPEQQLPWTQVEEHASFPTTMATRTEQQLTVGAGTFDVFTYVVTPPDAMPPITETFHFAKNLPGPPVLHVVKEGEDVIHRMELVADSRAK